MKKVSTLLAMLVAFCGMAWAQGSETLPFKVSDAPQDGQWGNNTYWYYIKPANIDGYHPEAWISAGEGYTHTDGALKLTNGTKPTDDNGLWCVVGNENNGYKFYNKGKGTTYIMGMTGSEANAYAKMIEATTQNTSFTTEFEYGASTSMPGNACFKLKNSANNWWNNRDTGHTGGAHLALWNHANSGPKDKGSAFTFISVGAKGELESAIVLAEPWVAHIGTELNKYTQPIGSQPLATLIKDAKRLIKAEGTQESEYQAAVEEIENVINNLQINQPQDGRFYRLRCVDGMRYLTTEKSTTNVNRLLTNDDQGRAALLFKKNNALLCFQNGLYFGNTKANNNSLNFLAVGATGQAFTFTGSTSQKGAYFIKVDGRFLYGDETLDSGSGTDNRSPYNWWLEEVTTLPVTVTEAGWATLYAPVALTIPADVKVYTGKVNVNKLTLTQVVTTIPANTPVLIEANANTYNFNINYEATATSTIDQSLTGSIETKAKPTEATTTIFTLQKHATAGLGFFKYKGGNLQGFRAYGENLLGTSTAAAGLVFDFGSVTGIEGVTKNNGEKAEIYDLSGRRVAKAQKGIYIINGKKVIIK